MVNLVIWDPIAPIMASQLIVQMEVVVKLATGHWRKRRWHNDGLSFPGTDCPVPDVGNIYLIWNA